MSTSILLGILVRHALTLFGGAGLLSDNEVSQLVGAISVLVGIALSVMQKQRSAQGVE